MRYLLTALAFSLAACATATAPQSTAGIAPVWDDARIEQILDRTQRTHLDPDLSALSAGERAAVSELLLAGERMHRLYLQQRHPQALAAADYLAAHPESALERDLFRLNSGPIASTLDNTREAFLSVAPEAPTRNVYPAGVTRATMDAYFAAHPERRDELLDDRGVVWAATPENRRRALSTLDRYPALDTLHPGLRARFRESADYLAVPYSVAYAEDIFFIYERLNAAAAHVERGDAAFARYLRLRARDLLADDYEGGDAAWITGQFTGNLNAQIGAYETYDDALFGVKTFFSLSLLVRDRPRSDELQAALADIQVVENALPYEHHREVRSDIPVGVYNIIADFGQARGANTATILPNDAYLARQYGRTILMRGNILLNDELFQETNRAFQSAIVPAQANQLTPEGGFYRTLWHEVGHYLGVDQTSDGRDLDVALEDNASLLEEMKADLVSLTAARILNERGRISDAQLQAIYASGIRRVLQKNRPRREQPYQTMQLIQWNWFLDQGALRFENGQLRIDHRRYPAAVTSLLRETLALQRNGDRAAANAFIDRWTTWRPDLHEVIAQSMRDSERTRFTLVTYEALDGAE
ncbi:MAG: NUDIX hydrolase [Alphaproteobacteria bacterium]|nr:MAG: NUDIX hydrolase [Alphaproteobacteria bacterium]